MSIVEVDTPWKEDWIFKKSGIDIYWFIFTTDTVYLVECPCPLSEQMIKPNKVEFIVYCMLEALSIVYVQALMYLCGSFSMGFFIYFLFLFFNIL